MTEQATIKGEFLRVCRNDSTVHQAMKAGADQRQIIVALADEKAELLKRIRDLESSVQVQVVQIHFPDGSAP